MNTIENIQSRRSVRKYKEEPIDRDTIRKIMEAVVYAPSWKNTQVVRYTIIDDAETIERLSKEAVCGFTFNEKTLSRAKAVAVQTVVTGICGYEKDGSFTTSKGEGWQMYDAGISAQTFCLAAHEYGVGTVIMGIYDEKKYAELLGLAENEMVTSVIAMGYPLEKKEAPPRKAVDEILKFF